MVAACGLLLYYAVVIMPRAAAYRHTLLALRSEQVQTLRLHTEELKGDKLVTEERILHGEAVSAFLALLSKATSHHSNHPRGGWSCFVDIDTTTSVPHFSFIVSATENDGVQFDLSSHGLDGWHYGTLRNDALKPFIEAQFHNGQ